MYYWEMMQYSGIVVDAKLTEVTMESVNKYLKESAFFIPEKIGVLHDGKRGIALYPADTPIFKINEVIDGIDGKEELR